MCALAFTHEVRAAVVLHAVRAQNVAHEVSVSDQNEVRACNKESGAVRRALPHAALPNTWICRHFSADCATALSKDYVEGDDAVVAFLLGA